MFREIKEERKTIGKECAVEACFEGLVKVREQETWRMEQIKETRKGGNE
jgi:hypothetical protein